MGVDRCQVKPPEAEVNEMINAPDATDRRSIMAEEYGIGWKLHCLYLRRLYKPRAQTIVRPLQDRL